MTNLRTPLQGPYFPTQGFGKYAFAPLRTVGLGTAAGAIWGAGKFGHTLGQFADRQFNLSGKAANAAYNRFGPAPKGLINAVDRMGIGIRWFK